MVISKIGLVPHFLFDSTKMSKTFDELIEERHSCRMFRFAWSLIFRFDSTPVSDEIISRIVKKIDLCPNSFGPHVHFCRF